MGYPSNLECVFGDWFFLHSAAAIILVVPIVIPLIQAAGIDPIHLAGCHVEFSVRSADSASS